MRIKLGALLKLSSAVILLASSLNVAAESGTKADVADGSAVNQSVTTNWREDYAYSMGVAAMHYVYPYWRMAHVRNDWGNRKLSGDLAKLIPNQALNQFWHSELLMTSDWQSGGGPNNDTTYSFAWVHVQDEPIILSVPPIDRYYTFQLVGANSDNFGYVSELNNGRHGGDYALLPQGWEGDLPQGVVAVAQVPSPWVVIIGRTYVANEADLPAVHKINNQFKLTTMSQWGKEGTPMPEVVAFKPYDDNHSVIDDPMAVWKTINRMLSENPPVGAEASVVSLFKDINIGPNLDLDLLDEASKRGLMRAAVDGLEQIKAAQKDGAGVGLIKHNGWSYSNSLGRTGDNGHFMVRTVHQSYAGIAANDPVEAFYYGSWGDKDGATYDAKNNYELTFPAGGEPDVKSFWSISAYDANSNLVSSEISRYSIGDRSPDLVRNADGSLTIALQNERPTDPNVNWLPTPAEGFFWLVLRAYQPEDDLLNGQWEVPPVTLVAEGEAQGKKL